MIYSVYLSFIQILGQGSYGTVVSAIHIPTNQARAVKIIPKAKVSNPERFRTEIEILKTLVKYALLWANFKGKL